MVWSDEPCKSRSPSKTSEYCTRATAPVHTPGATNFSSPTKPSPQFYKINMKVPSTRFASGELNTNIAGTILETQSTGERQSGSKRSENSAHSRPPQPSPIHRGKTANSANPAHITQTMSPLRNRFTKRLTTEDQVETRQNSTSGP